jgi:hypothetical protein
MHITLFSLKFSKNSVHRTNVIVRALCTLQPESLYIQRRSIESSPLVCYRTATKDTNEVALEIDSKGTRKSGAAPSNAPIGINTQLGKAKRYRYPNIIARAGGRLFNAI